MRNFQDAIENKKSNYFYRNYFQNDPLSKLLARVRQNICLVDNLAPPNKIFKQQRFAQVMTRDAKTYFFETEVSLKQERESMVRC